MSAFLIDISKLKTGKENILILIPDTQPLKLMRGRYVHQRLTNSKLFFQT